MNFDEISSASGFSDRTNLYRVFKKITGLSPRNFRQIAQVVRNTK